MGAESYLNNGVFGVDIGGIKLDFSKVSGIGASVEYEPYIEGGGRVSMLPKNIGGSGTITFEKGISTLDPYTASIFAAGVQLENITITLQKNGKVVESCLIESGIITSWELGELDALSTGVAIKKFTLAHTGMKIEK